MAKRTFALLFPEQVSGERWRWRWELWEHDAAKQPRAELRDEGTLKYHGPFADQARGALSLLWGDRVGYDEIDGDAAIAMPLPDGG
jgi:hypothetical protein